MNFSHDRQQFSLEDVVVWKRNVSPSKRPQHALRPLDTERIRATPQRLLEIASRSTGQKKEVDTRKSKDRPLRKLVASSSERSYVPSPRKDYQKSMSWDIDGERGANRNPGKRASRKPSNAQNASGRSHHQQNTQRASKEVVDDFTHTSWTQSTGSSSDSTNVASNALLSPRTPKVIMSPRTPKQKNWSTLTRTGSATRMAPTRTSSSKAQRTQTPTMASRNKKTSLSQRLTLDTKNIGSPTAALDEMSFVDAKKFLARDKATRERQCQQLIQYLSQMTDSDEKSTDMLDMYEMAMELRSPKGAHRQSLRTQEMEPNNTHMKSQTPKRSRHGAQRRASAGRTRESKTETPRRPRASARRSSTSERTRKVEYPTARVQQTTRHIPDVPDFGSSPIGRKQRVNSLEHCSNTQSQQEWYTSSQLNESNIEVQQDWYGTKDSYDEAVVQGRARSQSVDSGFPDFDCNEDPFNIDIDEDISADLIETDHVFGDFS